MSNLQRQVLHGVADVGRLKVDSAVDRLRALDPHLGVEPMPTALTADNARDLARGYDLVVDATDDPAARYAIDDACADLGLPWVYASIHRLEGQICVFDPQAGPRYRDLYPAPPPLSLAPSCAAAGVLGALPGVLGAMQAARAVRALIHGTAEIAGRVQIVDPWNMVFHTFTVTRGADRPPPSPVPPPSWRRLSPEGARDLAGPPTTAVDLREPDEILAQECPFPTVRVSPVEATERLVGLPGPVLLVCQSGRRSTRVAAALVEAGRDPALTWELQGGLRAWSAAEADPTWATPRPASPANRR